MHFRPEQNGGYYPGGAYHYFNQPNPIYPNQFYAQQTMMPQYAQHPQPYYPPGQNHPAAQFQTQQQYMQHPQPSYQPQSGYGPAAVQEMPPNDTQRMITASPSMVNVNGSYQQNNYQHNCHPQHTCQQPYFGQEYFQQGHFQQDRFHQGQFQQRQDQFQGQQFQQHPFQQGHCQQPNFQQPTSQREQFQQSSFQQAYFRESSTPQQQQQQQNAAQADISKTEHNPEEIQRFQQKFPLHGQCSKEQPIIPVEEMTEAAINRLKKEYEQMAKSRKEGDQCREMTLKNLAYQILSLAKKADQSVNPQYEQLVSENKEKVESERVKETHEEEDVKGDESTLGTEQRRMSEPLWTRLFPPEPVVELKKDDDVATVREEGERADDENLQTELISKDREETLEPKEEKQSTMLTEFLEIGFTELKVAVKWNLSLDMVKRALEREKELLQRER